MRQVVIILNRGGWGDGTIEYEMEVKNILEGIQKMLDSFHIRQRTIMFPRRKFILHFPKEAEILSSFVQKLLQRGRQLSVILLGYSTGAIMNIQVMRRFTKHKRVFSIQLGAPFFMKPLDHPRILDIRKKFDLFSKGNLISFLAGAAGAVFIGILRILSFQERHPSRAVKIFGHRYDWEDVCEHIERFIISHFYDKVAE